MDIFRLDRTNHIPHHSLAANIHSANRADMAQSIEDTGLASRVDTSQEPDDADHTLKLDAIEALLQRARTSNLDNVVYTHTSGRQLASRLAPVRICLVVDDMVGAQFLELLSFFV